MTSHRSSSPEKNFLQQPISFLHSPELTLWRVIIILAFTPLPILSILLPVVVLMDPRETFFVPPRVMLSDLLMHPTREGYAYVMTWAFFLFFLATVCNAALYCQKVRAGIQKEVRKQTVQTQSDSVSESALSANSVNFFLCVFCVPVSTSMVLMFDQNKKNWIHHFLHCAGAVVLIGSAVTAAGLWFFFVVPALEKCKGLIETEKDLMWKKRAAALLIVTVPMGPVIYCLQLFHDRILWSIPMLVLEVVVVIGGAVIMGLGFWDMAGPEKEKDH